MIYKAEEYGILPDKEVAAKLSSLLKTIASDEAEKTLIFQKGTYYLDTENCDEKMLYITNTVGDKEFSADETPHLNKIGINMQSIKNLKIEGNGAEFIIDGRATNMAMEDCENIKIDGITLDVKNPDMHEFTVESVTPFSATFRLDNVSQYKPYKNRFAFVGKGYESDFYKSRAKSWWHARYADGNLRRLPHPFRSAFKITETEPHVFKAVYPSAKRFSVGERYYIFDNRRQYAGIFVNRSKNITFKNVKQHFNYSLSLVCQDTENITVDSVDFSPRSKTERLVASCADFIQICMCKGQVNVLNSYFCGACDDAINVHGVHYMVKSIDGNKLTLKYKHPQTHAYNPLHEGDEIEFVNRFTLLKKGNAKILTSELVSEHTIEITVDSTQGLSAGDVIEDITMCPSLLYKNNTLDRIITRNMLVTTRGKVVIENNRFLNSTMASLLLSDDALSWYESGPVHDMTVKDNYFGKCYDEFIKILPECGLSTSPVHKNITITGNTFDSDCDKGILVKNAENVTIKDNVIKNSKVKDSFVKTVNAREIVTDF